MNEMMIKHVAIAKPPDIISDNVKRKSLEIVSALAKMKSCFDISVKFIITIINNNLS